MDKFRKKALFYIIGNLTLLIIILCSLCSCGKIKVEPKKIEGDIEAEIKVTDDYIEIHKFCDKKYGKLTIESEACIQDAMDYKDISINLELGEEIESFCKEKEDSSGCFDDLIDLFSSLE